MKVNKKKLCVVLCVPCRSIDNVKVVVSLRLLMSLYETMTEFCENQLKENEWCKPRFDPDDDTSINYKMACCKLTSLRI